MNENETVTIILPLPSPYLSPNKPPASRGGRIKKAQIARKQRKLACKMTKDTMVETAPWEKATIQAHFFHRQKRRRDDVNFLAMLKSAYDGIVDAGLLVDDDSDHLATLTPIFSIDKESPRVELTIECLVPVL